MAKTTSERDCARDGFPSRAGLQDNLGIAFRADAERIGPEVAWALASGKQASRMAARGENE